MNYPKPEPGGKSPKHPHERGKPYNRGFQSAGDALPVIYNGQTVVIEDTTWDVSRIEEPWYYIHDGQTYDADPGYVGWNGVRFTAFTFDEIEAILGEQPSKNP